MALSTWSADSSVWSGNSYIWDNNTYSATATLAGNGTFTSSQNAVYPVAVTMTQVILSELNEEDTVFPRSLSLGTNFGMTGTTAHVMPASITLDESGTITSSSSHAMPVTATMAGTSDMKNNVNFPESATLSMNSSTSSENNFLWNDIEEDEDTLWTKISDPDN